MSLAIICDKCDLILPINGNCKTVFIGNNALEMEERYHLCEKCLALLDEWVEEREDDD